MKKNMLSAVIFSALSFVACNKESSEDLGSPSVVITGNGYGYSDPRNDPGCSWSNHNDNGGNNPNNSMVVDFSIDNLHGTVDEKADLLLTNKTKEAVSYEWDFGNGEKSTEATPKFSYNMHGIYTVTLKATDARGEVKTTSHEITVLCIFGGTHTTDDE